MKKLFALFLCLLLSVAVSACELIVESDNNENSAGENSAAELSAGDNDDKMTGSFYPEIKGFSSFSGLKSFYFNTFKKKNDFSFVVADIDKFNTKGDIVYRFSGVGNHSNIDPEDRYNMKYLPNFVHFSGIVTRYEGMSAYDVESIKDAIMMYSVLTLFDEDIVFNKNEADFVKRDDMYVLANGETDYLSVEFNYASEVVNDEYISASLNYIKNNLLLLK